MIAGTFIEEPRNTICILGKVFTIRCRAPPEALTVQWIYNGNRVLITDIPDGLKLLNHNDLFEMEITCIDKRHYGTIQCLAILDIYTDVTEPSIIATIKVQGKCDCYRTVFSL